MKREYPHKSKGGPRSDSRSWMCRCGAEPTFLSQVHAGEWGACALALEEALAEAEARAERAEAERDAARKMLAECYRCALVLEEALAEAEARAERAEAERDAARKMLAECYRLSGADPDGDGWEHLWQTAVDEVRELRQQHDEMLRESRADVDKAVADAREALAKELDARAEAAIGASDKAEAKGDHYRANSDAGRWAAFQAAARIVRGGR